MRAQVVDVVKADVAGDELQPPRELEVGAPLQRRIGVAPGERVSTAGALELMLDVKEPDADCAAEQQHRRLHHHERLPADQQTQTADDQRDREIGSEPAAPDPLVRGGGDETRRDDDDPKRAQPRT
jgi:hypothetical protein